MIMERDTDTPDILTGNPHRREMKIVTVTRRKDGRADKTPAGNRFSSAAGSFWGHFSVFWQECCVYQGLVLDGVFT